MLPGPGGESPSGLFVLYGVFDSERSVSRARLKSCATNGVSRAGLKSCATNGVSQAGLKSCATAEFDMRMLTSAAAGVLIALIIAHPMGAFAQSGSSAIAGIVKDPAGDAVP